MAASLSWAGSYPRGTLCAVVGFIVVAGYYLRAWRNLRDDSAASIDSDATILPDGQDQDLRKIHYLQWGLLASILFFMLAGGADAANDWLDRLVGGLMGFCGALFAAMFGVGIVALGNLWKEMVGQLRKAKLSSLFLSMPVALVLLALGVSLFILLGMFADKFSGKWESLSRELMGLAIGAMFYSLWKGRGHAALMLRLILMVSFSIIIGAALAFCFSWTASQTAPMLVIFLFAIGSLNAIFYSRWVRFAVLKNNLE